MTLLKPMFTDGRIRQYRLPSVIDEDFAWFLGLMYGDGSIYLPTNRIEIACTTDEPEITQKVKDIVWAIFKYKVKIHSIPNGEGIRLCINSKYIVTFLTINNIDKEKSKDIQVPKLILESDPNIQMAFVSGYLDADGCFNKYNVKSGNRFREISFHSISLDFLDTIQDMLPNDIATYMSRVKVGKSIYRKDGFTINTQDSKVLYIKTESWTDAVMLLNQSVKADKAMYLIRSGQATLPRPRNITTDKKRMGFFGWAEIGYANV